MTNGGSAAEGPVTDSTADEDSASGPHLVAHRRRRVVLIGAIAAVVLVADQITKSLAVGHLSDHRVHLVGPFYLALSYNTGVAFSLGTGLTLPIILIAVAIVGSIIWLARGSLSMIAAVAVGLVLGGAIGNLCDRLFRGHHGAVVDFFYSRFWPTFNVADSCIVVGSFLLVFSLWRNRAP